MPLKRNGSVLPNISLGADTHRQNGNSRGLLRAGQL
jgi:hypothetical protein